MGVGADSLEAVDIDSGVRGVSQLCQDIGVRRDVEVRALAEDASQVGGDPRDPVARHRSLVRQAKVVVEAFIQFELDTDRCDVLLDVVHEGRVADWYSSAGLECDLETLSRVFMEVLMVMVEGSSGPATDMTGYAVSSSVPPLYVVNVAVYTPAVAES